METHNTFTRGYVGNLVQAGTIDAVHLHLPPPAVRGVPRQAPAPPRAFTNQSRELARIDTAARTSRLIVISGMSGVGKSSLALEWLRRRAERYPDGQLYARYADGADGDLLATADPGEVAAGFLRAFGVQAGAVPHAPAERFALLRTLLAPRKAAILLDSVRVAEQVSPLLPGTAGCLVIATTTRELSALTTQHGAGIDLHPWPRETARRLLAALGAGAGWRTGERENEIIVRACAGLPLALAVTAANLTAHHRTARPLTPVIDALAVGPGSLAAALDRALGDLPPAAARLYAAAGRLPVPWITGELASALLGSREQSASALDELCTHHLLTADGVRYHLHDLVRRHAAAVTMKETTMTDDVSARSTAIAMGRYLCAGLADAEAILTPSHTDLLGLEEAGALPDPLRPSLTSETAALDWLEVNRELIPAATRHCADLGLHALAFEIAHRAWPGVLRIGILRRPMLEVMLAAGRTLDDKPMIAMAQTGWPSVWCAEHNYPEALAAADEAETIYTELDDPRMCGQAVNSRAKTYRAMGQLGQSWDEHERALALRRQAGYTRGVGLTLLDQGLVALELVQPQLALERYEEARRVLLEQLPAEGLAADLYDGTIAAIGAARARAELGHLALAVAELARADASMAERGSLRGRGFAAEALGAVHERARNTEDAIEAYRRALAFYANVEARGARRVADRLESLGVAP